VLASSKTEQAAATELGQLIAGYRLCARSEGKSKNTVDIVTSSMRYFEAFLRSEGLPTDATHIGTTEIRAFVCYLQQKRCFSDHPFSRRQERGLSSHTINCYLRSIRAFWSWLIAEEMIANNPFLKVKLPRLVQSTREQGSSDRPNACEMWRLHQLDYCSVITNWHKLNNTSIQQGGLDDLMIE